MTMFFVDNVSLVVTCFLTQRSKLCNTNEKVSGTDLATFHEWNFIVIL